MTDNHQTGDYLTVEYFAGKGFQPIGTSYPKSLEDCARSVVRLKDMFPKGSFGIVKLVELMPVQKPAIVTDWVDPADLVKQPMKE